MTVYEDEIDLRPYILTLIRYRWLILLLGLIFGAAGLVFSLLQSRSYSATATILLTRSRSELALAEEFPTLTEPVDARSRMDAMLSIIQSDETALQVIDSLGDMLPADQRNPRELKLLVELNSEGDLILIDASAGSPELAARIANAYAEQAVKAINEAYSGEQSLAEIQNQVEATRKDYENSQSRLEDFIRDNRINVLEKQILEAQVYFQKITEARPLQIAYYSERKKAMENLKNEAEALKRQIQGGSSSEAGDFGDALAVLVARATALGVGTESVQSISPPQAESGSPAAGAPQVSSSPPTSGVILNLQIGDLDAIRDTSSNYVADLNALINLSAEEIAKAEEAIQALGEQVNQAEGYDGVEETAARIRTLETQLESERARQKELSSQRDVAWQAYQAILQKEVELRSTGQANSIVNLASRAVTPQQPESRGTVNNTLIGALLGIILGAIAVLGLQWWRSFNSAENRPVKTSLRSDSAD